MQWLRRDRVEMSSPLFLGAHDSMSGLSRMACRLAAGAVAAGRRNRLLYNRLWGPARGGRRLTVKAGFNNWRHIVEQPMRSPMHPASCFLPVF